METNNNQTTETKTSSAPVIDEESLKILKELKQKSLYEKLESEFFKDEEKAPLKKLYEQTKGAYPQTEEGFKNSLIAAQLLLKNTMKDTKTQTGNTTQTTGQTDKTPESQQQQATTAVNKKPDVIPETKTDTLDLTDRDSVINYFKGKNVPQNKLELLKELPFDIFTN